MITKREAAIISAYTGYLLGDFAEMRKYAAEKFGAREGDISDFALAGAAERLHDLALEDFKALPVGDEPERPAIDPWDVENALYDALRAQDARVEVFGSNDGGDVHYLAQRVAEALNGDGE